MSRFFLEGAFAVGDRVVLEGADARKLAGVLRAAPGDRVEILDGRSGRFEGRVRAVERERVHVELVGELVAAAREPELRITLAQGIPKGQKMDFVVEKAVELGVVRIVPLLTERVVARADGTQKVERWRRLARGAAQQCGRATVPEVSAPMTVEQALTLAAGHDAVLMPWELAPQRPLRDRLQELGAPARLLIVVGPEGGFAQREAEQAQAAGAHLVSLGARILRTETAALVLISALLALRGEL